MAELLGRRKMVDRIIAIASVAVAAGLVLYWQDWQDRGSFGDWVSSSFGLTLTIDGSLARGARVRHLRDQAERGTASCSRPQGRGVGRAALA